jgi:hypothetical protein
VWFMATIAACCCVFALVYNVGQVANQKEQTINAADAAALSGALVEARMLNFEAYTNRAMVANEVTVAQLVSLDSWIGYNNEFLQWTAIYTSILPGIDDITQAIADVSTEVTDAVDGELIPNVIPALEWENTALWYARDYANDFGLVAANDIARQVASANETTLGGRYDEAPGVIPSFAAGVLLLNESNWTSFTDGYTGDGRANAKGVILNSRDPFSTKRPGGTLVTAVNVVMAVSTLPLCGFTCYFGVEKTSTLTSLESYDHWAAQDTIDPTVSTLSICWHGIIPLPCFGSPTVLPTGPVIAYGHADADSDGNVDQALCDYKPTTTNCTMAVTDNPSNIDWSGPHPQSNGIPSLRDLAQNLATDDPCTTNNGSDSPSLSYVTAVQKSGKAAQTTEDLGMNTDVSGPQGSPQMTDNLQNNQQLTSIAAACTFFLRPDLNKKDVSESSLARADGVHEYASLYNPYWQARLTNPDTKFKQALYVLIGSPLLSGVTPQPTNQ